MFLDQRTAPMPPAVGAAFSPMKMQIVLRSVEAIVAAGVAIATFGYRYLSYNSFSNDHFLHLARAQQMLMGALPVRDFVESGLPLMAGLSALAQLLRPGLHTEVLMVSALFAIAAAVSFFLALRVSGSKLVGLAASAVTVLAYPVSYSYPKVLPYAMALMAFWCYAGRPSRLRLTLVAAAVVLAFLLRHDHGVILAGAAMGGVVARHGRTSGVPLATLAIAGALLASPYLIWVQVHEGLVPYIRDGIAFSARESSKANWEAPSFSMDLTRPLVAPLWHVGGPVIYVRWAPEPSETAIRQAEAAHGLKRLASVAPDTWQYELSGWSSSSIRRLVKDPAVMDTQGVDRAEFHLTVPAPPLTARVLAHLYGPGEGLPPRPNGVAAWYYLGWMIPAVSACILVIQRRTTSAPVRSIVVMAIAAQLLMDWTMLRDPLETRVRDIIEPMAVLLAAVTAGLWRTSAPVIVRWTSRVAAVALLALALEVAAAAGSMQEYLPETNVMQGWSGISERIDELRQEFAPPNERTGRYRETYRPFVEYLRRCTSPGARFFTMAFVPELFVYTGRGFAGGHESLTPGLYIDDRHATLMLDRLAREDVPFVIMDTETRDEMPVNYPRVFAHVNSRYREVARFTFSGEKKSIVLADATRKPAGTFGPNQLPCFTTSGEAR